MPALLSTARSFLTSARTRQLLLWCLPALLLGLALRIALTAQMPYAFFHDDTPDFLTTPDELLNHHHFELHEKKTFLVPILFTLPFLTGLPALIVVPVALHLLGLALVVMVGALIRHWFRHWRLFIIPLTVLLAINPSVIWYEHTLMAESIFAFTTALVAYAGTLYAREQTRGRYLFLLVALFLEAGGRPEGKLLFGFGLLLLLLVHLRAWKVFWPRIAGLVVLAVATNFITRTSQAGLLLYTSVARLTPTDLKCAPGFEPYIAPIRADLQQRWAVTPSFPKVRDRRAIAAAVRGYLESQKDGRIKHAGVNGFCLELAKETCRRHALEMPIYALEKFRAVSDEPPGGPFSPRWIAQKQVEAFVSSPRSFQLAKGLTGQNLGDETAARAFFQAHYHPVEWFNRWRERWQQSVNFITIPLQAPEAVPEEDTAPLSLVTPLYFFLGALGLCAVAFRRGELQLFHLAWGAALLAFFFTVMLTANVRPRFRFVFEPYWFIYLGLLLECLCGLIAWAFLRARTARA